jgi:hypothetical protein
MAVVQQFFWWLLLAPAAYAASVSDAVNERIPVSRAALEAHWHVDCASSWARFSDAWLQAQAGAGCDISVELRDDLELCAFIYQPPGTEGSEGLTETCMDCCRRDYRGAVELLDSAGPVDLCAELAKLPGAQAGCTSPQPQ